MLLSTGQLDAFRELTNIGMGKAAALLNNLVHSHVTLKIPTVKVEYYNDIKKELSALQNEKLSTVKVGFYGDISGVTEVVFPSESALNLVSLLTGEHFDSPRFDSFKEGTLNEVANILLNSIMGVMANLLNTHFDYDLPTYTEEKINDLFVIGNDINPIVFVGEAQFVIRELKIEGSVFIIFELGAFDHLKKVLDNLML